MDFLRMAAILVLALLTISAIVSGLKGRAYSRVIATVIEVEVTQRKRRETGESYTAFVPIYTYSVDGSDYAARGALTEDAEKHKVGDTRAIVYKKDDPNQIILYVHDRRYKSLGLIIIILGFLAIIIGLIFQIV